MCFGSDLRLCDSMFDAERRGISGVAARDLAVNGEVQKELQNPGGGRLFLIFYNCTHHDYYWPESRPPKFVPYARAWKYSDFSIGPERLKLIKNRYLNAVNFEDALVGGVIGTLRAGGDYDSSILCALGDHGEEFLEHGRLLHASDLYLAQTKIPFLLRFPSGRHPAPGRPLFACQVDLFPTLLDYLGLRVQGPLDGESLFHKAQNEVIVAAQNGDRDPARFCIRSLEYAAFFRYGSDTEPTQLQRALYLERLTDAQDRPVNLDLRSAEGRRLLEIQFGRAFRSLFPEARL